MHPLRLRDKARRASDVVKLFRDRTPVPDDIPHMPMEAATAAGLSGPERHRFVVGHLSDIHGVRVFTGRVLVRKQPPPCDECTAFPELCAAADRGHNGSRRRRDHEDKLFRRPVRRCEANSIPNYERRTMCMASRCSKVNSWRRCAKKSSTACWHPDQWS
jgi:hypothetical protein